ncbi:dipeptide/oligopeptide/nickel ABC transporter permease/ATP-binding protein [Yinghuangia soli]|uniref:Dipeptide/oligopeptide/nickel ABC transporter permease/ATP-binding protein n=1 Tax=Yinghuangia soli TaxID=2908204 RepID=A0AA41TYL5_9ACTN|nr:dipeptide/oligopeptide/nickel ABC transporter permease/ATP-binding protein [Yinghuangia soli]MCF2527938.1 dipeptide/oligopeptide/nickel ABC transporter permease/ATP-binding protein [Yinghuangia soli]
MTATNLLPRNRRPADGPSPGSARTKRRRRPGLMLTLGLTGLGLLVVLAVVAPWIWGDRAEELGPSVHLGSSGEHWLGTDALGRDIFARTMVATRLTLELSALATLIASTVGITLGTLIWVSGPRIRAVGLRVIDVMISYPAVILALAIAAILDPGPKACVIAIGAAGSPSFARLTANLAASVAGRDFVGSARLLGVGPLRLMRRHILPNIAEPLLVLLSVSYAHTLMALSGLSFLGLGVQLPDYDWGQLLAGGLQSLYTNPVEAVGPAVAIVLAGLSASFVGDGLAAAANRSRRADAPAKATKPAEANAAAAVGTAPAVPDDAVLVVDDLRVLRKDGTALVDGVSFHIGAAEIVGVVGESGSGKSLTAMAAARLLPGGLHATARTAELRHPDSAALDLVAPGAENAETRRRLAVEIGIVYQDPSASFNPALKLGGQLTETLRVHLKASRREAREQAIEQLDFVRLTDPASRLRQYPHELSGGMRQRAMIAAALLTRPRLIIADEPTTALDVTVQAEVLRLLRAANERDGTAMLFISHDIAVVGDLCDRVLVMYAGRLVEELTAEDVREGRARHPYTQALLAATPRLDTAAAAPAESAGGPEASAGEPASAEPVRTLAAIPGRPPQPDERPPGCAFAPRCPQVLAACHDTPPPVHSPAPGLSVLCHLEQAGARTGETGTDKPLEAAR